MMTRRERLEAKQDEALKAGDYATADRIFEELKWICRCGATADEQYDSRGIYAGRMCDKCFRRKFRSSYDEYADGYSAPGEGFFD